MQNPLPLRGARLELEGTVKSLLLSENGMAMGTQDDAMAIIASGLPGCIVRETDLPDSFFDLRNGLAGEIFQKFVHYRFRVGIVLPSPGRHGDRVVELVRDHSRHPYVRFFDTEAEAVTWLSESCSDA